MRLDSRENTAEDNNPDRSSSVPFRRDSDFRLAFTAILECLAAVLQWPDPANSRSATRLRLLSFRIAVVGIVLPTLILLILTSFLEPEAMTDPSVLFEGLLPLFFGFASIVWVIRWAVIYIAETPNNKPPPS
jgi:hypothetical protein